MHSLALLAASHMHLAQFIICVLAMQAFATFTTGHPLGKLVYLVHMAETHIDLRKIAKE